MSFLELNIKDEYRSLEDDIVKDFYTPVLKQSKKYQRAVGFFSSSALIDISRGIAALVKNGGTIELIASPKISEEDVVAIEKGLKLKDDVIRDSLISQITEPKNQYEKDRINFLINLIAAGILLIKIAILDDDSRMGMYHEKMGLMYDSDDNIIAFSGSMNESDTAFLHNYESIDVFRSWTNEANRVNNKKLAFEAIWDNYEPRMQTMEFPEAAKRKLFKYRENDRIDLGIDNPVEYQMNSKTIYVSEPIKSVPRIPKFIKWYDYQNQATAKWQENGYVGIFDMATGTGKTYTGLKAIVELYEHRKAPLAIFIVCPYQHLVTQWVEDIRQFGMNPIICFSASSQPRWRERLKDACLSLEIGLTDHFCAIFTNATFCTDSIASIINRVKGQAVLVVDEAHNFGAENSSKYLDSKIPYRLALSATLERHGDDIGTKRLFDYFGDKCIEYTLKEAINNDKLVRYYYHPVLVSFQPDELIDYIDISKKIASAIMAGKKDEPSEYAKKLMIKRARMVASAREKVERLVEVMEPFKKDSHMLVYCGATTVRDVDFSEDRAPEEEKKQVDVVTNLLGNSLQMKVAKFTSEEDEVTREVLKKEFDEGTSLQALIAIRCLDEGVNIPSIRKAFILASSTNPKEYIQRRGRVLRKYKGKTYADIYDFVVSPLPLELVNHYDEDTVRLSKSLVKREIIRMKDFADIAENSSVADELIYDLIEQYDIDLEEASNEPEY